MVQSIKPGTSSKQVLAMQKYLNKGFGYSLEESGTYDEATLEAVKELQSKMGLSLKNGVVDEQTMLAMKEAVEKRAWVTVNGIRVLVTEEQLAELRKRAIAAAVAKVQPFVSLADEAYTYYTAHNTLRQNNIFLSAFVELGSGATMPELGLFKAAQSAAASILSQAKAGTLTKASMETQARVIKKAAFEMEYYRNKLYGGGADFITTLEHIQNGAILALQVLAAVATAGASLHVQVGVMAAVGMYKQTLTEVDRLGKDANYNVSQGQKNILTAGATEAGIELFFKGAKGKELMSAVAAKAAEKCDAAVLKYAIRVADGGVQEMLKEALRLAGDYTDPKKELTVKILAERLATAFAVGTGLKVIDPCVKEIGKGGFVLTKEDLRAFGKYDLDKSGEEAVKQAAKALAKPLVLAKLQSWTYNSPHDKFEKKVHEDVAAHADLHKVAKEKGKKKK